MALLVKVRHTFGHRWMPFFLPIAASLTYVLLVVLLVPDSFSTKASATTDEGTESTAASAGPTSGDNPRPSAKRRVRSGARVGSPGAAVAPGGVPQPAVPAPAVPAPPASPDGND